jgi:hypothetical protein
MSQDWTRMGFAASFSKMSARPANLLPAAVSAMLFAASMILPAASEPTPTPASIEQPAVSEQLKSAQDTLNTARKQPLGLTARETQVLVESVPASERALVETMVQFTARKKEVSIDRILRFRELTRLVQQKDTVALTAALKNTPDLNQLTTARGENLLMLALGIGAPDAVLELLLANGIDVNAVNDEQRTAAHLVLTWASPDSVPKIEMLRRYGADLDLKDKSGASVNDILKARAN